MKLTDIIQQHEGLDETDILQTHRQACWDLYISNLPDPIIVDTQDKSLWKQYNIPEEMRDSLPRGFCIDPKTWTIYFNRKDLPKNLTFDKSLDKYVSKKEKNSERKTQKLCARSLFQHEDTHFTKVPGDSVTEAVLIDSALKGFRDKKVLENKELARAYSYISLNVMADLVGDTLRAKEGYGREDFGDLAVWTTRELLKEARRTNQKPSTLWQAFTHTYEKLWNEDLGLNSFCPTIDPIVENAATKLVEILGTDWQERSNWAPKIRRVAEVLEPLITKSAEEAKEGKSRYKNSGGEEGKGKNKNSGGGLQMPDDVRTQMGNPTQSPLGDNKKKMGSSSGDVDNKVVSEIYRRNQDAPIKFAGTMGALYRLDPDDALRLMYRERAKELFISIIEKENQLAQRLPSYQTIWNVGDPVVGRGGLELIPSLLASGKPVPGFTTYKRKSELSSEKGRLKKIPDLYIVIDSSGSMDWYPWNPSPNSRGDFDKAILAAEGGALHALAHGAKVAVLNFSGTGDFSQQEYTQDIDMIEKAIMVSYRGGTVVPTKEVVAMIEKTRNPLLTCLMSDCAISNTSEAAVAFCHSISKHDSLAVFNINKGTGSQFTSIVEPQGAIIYNICRIEDLAGIVYGQIKKTYDSRGPNAN